ncbi:MAG: HIT family protein [Flavobacteriales bacterium]|nr:HIT family protein [Flavobacteriales bacterium]
MASIFTQIIKGEIPCHKIAEDENFFAFLDINPLTLGHTLVVPKVEIDYIFDHDDKTLAELIVFSKKVSKAIEGVITCERIAVSVIGLEVPHTHIHLIPMTEISDTNFSRPKLKHDPEQFAEIASKISENFDS